MVAEGGDADFCDGIGEEFEVVEGTAAVCVSRKSFCPIGLLLVAMTELDMLVVERD